MEHTEGCLNKGKSFPCCADEMCPCDLYNFEKLMEENARYRDALTKIGTSNPGHYDAMTAYFYTTIAKEALKGELE